jgi:hypothetical protein
MDGAFGLGLLGFAVVVALSLGIVVAFPVWLYHRREVLRMRGTNAKEVLKLRERLEVLERRCVKLEEQVTTAHLLIADEQRSLDKKLSKIVPEGAHISSESEESSSRSKKRERAHD